MTKSATSKPKAVKRKAGSTGVQSNWNRYCAATRSGVTAKLGEADRGEIMSSLGVNWGKLSQAEKDEW